MDYHTVGKWITITFTTWITVWIAMGDKPPSRKRYERENPTVSFRISRDKADKLDELVDGLETTKKDWFESIIGDEDGRFSAVFEQGFTKGQKEAAVSIPCWICGEPVTLDTDGRKERLWDLVETLNEADNYSAIPFGVEEFRFRHDACPNDV